MPILDALRKFLDALRAAQPPEPSRGRYDDADAFLSALFNRFPFTTEAQNWLRQRVRVQVDDLTSTTGGGGWYPDARLVRLHTAQYEAAIHELAHAVWHERRRDRAVRDGLVAAVQRLAADEDPRWAQVHALAGHYVHGILSQPGFERGMLLPQGEWGAGGGPRGEWNDWEMYAGLASGCMADIRLLPPYLHPYYGDLFTELPPEAPAPHR